MIVQDGSLNLTALVVPDLIVQMISPKVALLNGVPTSILGMVGTATWGPVGAPVAVSTYADFNRAFGPLQARKYDLGTGIAIAHMQGANNMRAVRVTDGTDVAAQVAIQTNCLTLTSRHTGSFGNATRARIEPGSAVGTSRVTIFLPQAGILPEVFDNIAGSGATLWANMAAAINNGQSGLRGRSEIVVATAGVGTTAPLAATHALTGGTDGAANVTATMMMGQDTQPRRGMYALRGTAASVAVLADVDDPTTWANQIAYGRSEGTYMIVVGPAGDTISAAVSAKQAAGADDQNIKVLHGDWLYWNDTVSARPSRMVSPQHFMAGLMANLAPHLGTLNKPIYGVVGSQRNAVNAPYSQAELTELGRAGIDVITNPVPGGHYWAPRFGRNASSMAAVRGDNHTRMTNYIAATINGGMGRYVGRLHTPDARREAKVTLDSFFGGMRQQGMIGNAEGTTPWQVQIDGANNPPTRVALGYMQADVKVQYLSVIEYLVVNVEGGQSVEITRRALEQAA